MYDTIKGILITKEDLTKYFKDVYEKVNHKTGEIHLRGNSGNFSLLSNDIGYSFIGSLTKEKLNHNFSAITNKQTSEIIENISDNIHFNFKEGILSRVDFGNCFSMTEKPEFYFNSLGYLNSFLDRTPVKKSSLYYGYSNDRRSLIFYDKTKDYLDNKREIPEEYQNGNYLRYELKLKRLDSFKKKLKLNSIKVSNLDDPQFFNNLLDYWKQLYQEIQKEPKGIINMKNRNLTWSDVQDLAVIEYIKNWGGLSHFYEWIDLETKRQNFKKGSSKKYIRDRAKEVTKSKLRVEKDRLINELNSKVNQTYKNYKV